MLEPNSMNYSPLLKELALYIALKPIGALCTVTELARNVRQIFLKSHPTSLKQKQTMNNIVSDIKKKEKLRWLYVGRLAKLLKVLG